MKIILRFCSKWGNYSTKIHILTKLDIFIRELRDIIETLTDIESNNQILMVI